MELTAQANIDVAELGFPYLHMNKQDILDLGDVTAQLCPSPSPGLDSTTSAI
jgi:hypothetical protein